MLPSSSTSWQAALTAALCAFAPRVDAADPETYAARASQAIESLNLDFYNVETGIWDNAWWNSANVLTTIAEFAKLSRNDANELNVGGYMRNTFNQAQKTDVKTTKSIAKNGMVSSVYCLDAGKGCMAKREFLGKRGFQNFLNEYYDDEGWWALALIRAYDAAGDQGYLDAAVDIFKDMKTGIGTPCGGGIFWSKDRKYVNAIANELYLSVAASLANRVSEEKKRKEYLSIAKSQWQWFERSGMINENSLINDGLDSNCKNNGLQTWSYNQGVILGGLAELSMATGDIQYVEKAMPIAKAAIQALQNEQGILVETDKCELRDGNCGKDGQQFKGVFIRNLRYLHAVAPDTEFSDFIMRNADFIWDHDRDDGKLGASWPGPFVAHTGPSQSSALDALVAAIAVSQ
ncbi:hypothetical protein JDV02_007561 [Purpureocillium takamizusanense]|uniref:Mannan endo-1,6-alpha-mannosidase n=1 Tax=Purpureocillium takamizusanense TaxID=2060973 RepID=A0A9Q8QMN8_9HYPO|nr:uncharacterized protein JDV02_007561 [Purpureocillium takamizusanense]UNI21586.1 hypothetical protein JDV02_007561 [Purpureocillium takamizusanense]